MIEIEVKVRIDHEAVIPRLDELGASFEGTEHHNDVYYNAPHRDFSMTDEALRLRECNGRSYLTYKGKKMDAISKTREEIETPVIMSDMQNILGLLGFTESGSVRKIRQIFECNGFTVSLDSVEGLGEFMEIEIISDSNIDYYRKKIFELVELLGASSSDSIQISYLEMLLEIQK